MRRLAVLQPSYLPWLGYFEQIARSDVFVFYDDVQFDKNGWRNRNRIRTDAPDGWSWLTVPVRLPEHFPKITDVTVDARVPFRKKHRRAVEMAYAKAPYRKLLDGDLAGLFEGDETHLADVTIHGIEVLMKALEIETELFRSSQLGISGDRNTRLLNLCKHFGATHYYSGAAAQVYLDTSLFENNGITVEWQHYEHPTYQQVREPFISHLSMLDALMNVGPQAKEFLRAQ